MLSCCLFWGCVSGSVMSSAGPMAAAGVAAEAQILREIGCLGVCRDSMVLPCHTNSQLCAHRLAWIARMLLECIHACTAGRSLRMGPCHTVRSLMTTTSTRMCAEGGGSRCLMAALTRSGLCCCDAWPPRRRKGRRFLSSACCSPNTCPFPQRQAWLFLGLSSTSCLLAGPHTMIRTPIVPSM